jgi:hypothetical protein
MLCDKCGKETKHLEIVVTAAATITAAIIRIHMFV